MSARAKCLQISSSVFALQKTSGWFGRSIQVAGIIGYERLAAGIPGEVSGGMCAE